MSPSIYYVSRSEWGCSPLTEAWIRRRPRVPATAKTEIFVHHTASIDDDDTPNRWTFERAAAYMRALEGARPELGPLPYSENVAVAEDLSAVWILEGRGILEMGAHTAGHNTSGVGWGILANFDRADPGAAELALEGIRSRAYELRTEGGLLNLGSRLNPRGWVAWGHRDVAAKSCPGDTLYPLLEGFSIGSMLSNQDREEIAEIVRAEISAHFGPAWIGTGSQAGRRFIKGVVDSVWHAQSHGRKTIETLDQVHDQVYHGEV